MSDKDVSLADLRLTIRAHQSRNLLDAKHYKYTYEQLLESAKSGSIFKKSSYIKVRDAKPQVPVKPGVYVAKGTRLQGTLRSNVQVIYPKFADLDSPEVDDKQKMIDEAFALEQADAAAYDDHRPALTVDKKYNEVSTDEDEDE